MGRDLNTFIDELLRDKVSLYCLATGLTANEDDDMKLDRHTDSMVYPVMGSSESSMYESIASAVKNYIGIYSISLDRPNVFLCGLINGSSILLTGYVVENAEDAEVML
jgi:hypothetical protein